MPSGIYVHLPFCRARCSYCPFAISTDSSLEGRYVAALLREIEGAEGGEAATLYFGGGTPSRLTIANLERIVTSIRQRFDLGSDAEVTVEANPEDVTPLLIEAWKKLGVTRVSVGVQSFVDAELKAIGRMHGGTGARRAVAAIHESGIRTNLDLIAGLPGQSETSFRHSLEEAIALGTGHVSLYMLDLESGTPLEQRVREGRTTVPQDEAVEAMYLLAVGELERAGLLQYEISNFARPGEESRHNLGYWERATYFGFGMGAHRFDGTVRSSNDREIEGYIRRIERDGDATVFREKLTEAEARHETIFLALRQKKGIDEATLRAVAGDDPEGWIERGQNEGWLERDGDRVRFTPRGFVVSSDLMAELF